MQTYLLILAAFSYSVGGYFMKLADGLTNFWSTLAVFALFIAGAGMQSIAMRGHDLSITYIVVLGLEAITALGLGVLVLGESLSLLKLIGILLIVGGVALLRW